MRVGERGQATIPKNIRDRFGLEPKTEVDFHVDNGAIVLNTSPKKLGLKKWRGLCKQSFRELGYSSVDEFIDNMRGR